MNTISCTCEKCGLAYEKPASFQEYLAVRDNVFFRWSLAFCDECRLEKQTEALKNLPKILEILGGAQNPTQ